LGIKRVIFGPKPSALHLNWVFRRFCCGENAEVSPSMVRQGEKNLDAFALSSGSMKIDEAHPIE
jgi:hypothetical protein